MTREQELEFVLKELLRLYDWRMEVGGREKQGLIAPADLKKMLNQYGREKKEAWKLARKVLGNPHFETERCGFDRNGSHSNHCYVCTCGWQEEPR